MYGKPEYQTINQLFNQRLQALPFLIACHRGFAHANIIENTVDAMRLARLLGADIMETDTTPTFDNELVMIHPNRERQLFNREINVSEMHLEQLQALHLYNGVGAETTQHVDTLDNFMRNIPQDMLIHFDRNEKHLPLLLAKLDHYPDQLSQIMIKVAPTTENYELLASHPRKYMIIPIVRNADDLARTFTQLDAPINFVGLETVIEKRHQTIMTAAFFQRIFDEHLAPLGNGLNLGASGGKEIELFGAFDDQQSLFGDPMTNGWGRIAQLGVKMINTDWPCELKQMRAKFFE